MDRKTESKKMRKIINLGRDLGFTTIFISSPKDEYVTAITFAVNDEPMENHCKDYLFEELDQKI